MKKRGLASLFIVSIIAIAAVVGVIFAFNNSGKNKSVSGIGVPVADKETIKLNLDIVDDPSKDNGMQIADTEGRSEQVTITVPGNAARRDVEPVPVSYRDTPIKITRVGSKEEAGKTGINVFEITAEGSCGETLVKFAATEGGKSVYVKVSADIKAKYMEVKANEHFGVRKGTSLDLAKLNGKYKFYAHKNAVKNPNKLYTVSVFEPKYELKQHYNGVNVDALLNGKLEVSNQCTESKITVNVGLDDMVDADGNQMWIPLEFYVFDAASNNDLKIDSLTAYKENPTVNTYDLILNRDDKSNAAFILEWLGLTQGNYGFLFDVDNGNEIIGLSGDESGYNYACNIEANSTGEAVVTVVGYPIIKTEDGTEIAFSDKVTDVDVQIKNTFKVRVRNEFHKEGEAEALATANAYVLTPTKKTINAFYFKGQQDVNNTRTDTFTLDTGSGKQIKVNANVVFELEVVGSAYAGVYDAKGSSNGNQYNLYDILNVYYLAADSTPENKKWEQLSVTNQSTYYNNTFAVSFKYGTIGENFLTNTDITALILRARTVNELSVGGYAACEITLEPTYAIDKVELITLDSANKYTGVDTLRQSSDGHDEIALVYNSHDDGFTEVEINVCGMFANGKGYDPLQQWNTLKVSDNRESLPFVITSSLMTDDAEPKYKTFKYGNSTGYKYLTYKITADDFSALTPYEPYQFAIQYPGMAEPRIINICVYPTVETLSMDVVSNRGTITKTTYTTKANNQGSVYEYVNTTYVRRGYDYSLAINTPGVAVGAYATIDTVNGEVVNARTFDARNRAEGIYECVCTLHACSDDVYQSHARTFTVNFIVVEPVSDVRASLLSIDLQGIGDYKDLELKITKADGNSSVDITDSPYLVVELAQTNENVSVSGVTEIDQNGQSILVLEDKKHCRIKAEYLTDKTVELGFKVYKRYDFVDEEYIINYKSAEYIVTVPVKITRKQPNDTINLFDHKTNGLVANDKKVGGNYIELISSSDDANFNLADSTKVIDLLPTEKARNQKMGIAAVKWENGDWAIQPVNQFETAISIGNYRKKINNGNSVSYENVPVANASIDGNQVTISPNADVTSMSQYALMVYACDSLRYVETKNGVVYAMPDTYELVILFVGSQEAIKSAVEDLQKGEPHDANSGKRNKMGSFNWVIQSNKPEEVAALFYTVGGTEYDSDIKQNFYYIDDLYTVLGWNGLEALLALPKDPALANYTRPELEKHVVIDGVDKTVGTMRLEPKDRMKMAIDLDGDAFKSPAVVDESDRKFYAETYCHGDVVVYFRINGMIFYAIDGINSFEIKISGGNGVGPVTPKNLDPKDINANGITEKTLPRGVAFGFTSNLNEISNWRMDDDGFAENVQATTASPSYEGGVYSFYPYMELAGNRFEVKALTSTVTIKVMGGVEYLNLQGKSEKLYGNKNRAIYNVTMRVDQPTWKRDLLTYTFVYDGIPYELFKNTNVSYVNMPGGKARLEFKLSENVRSSGRVNGYYTYKFTIEVATVVVTADVDPFYDISGAELILRENLNGSILNKTPVEDRAVFELEKGGITGVNLSHFAETTVNENNRSAMNYVSGQTDSDVIYVDKDSAGGLLVIHPSPYFINVAKLELSSDDVTWDEVLAEGLDGEITTKVTYRVAFTQMVYNKDKNYYQPYNSGSENPGMVSTWSAVEGYQWTGRYYFRTKLNLVSNLQVAYRIPEKYRQFKITVKIHGDNGNEQVAIKTLHAKYRDNFSVDPSTETEDYAVRTISQTQYQALGTSATYDVDLYNEELKEGGYIPNWSAFTLNGVGANGNKIDGVFATVTLNSTKQTLRVDVKGDTRAIGQKIEVRIPYTRQGDYVNPYLSIVIIPVYFEVEDLEVIGHYESQLILPSRNDISSLNYRANFKFASEMKNTDLVAAMDEFNQDLLSNSLVFKDITSAEGKITVQFPYTYVNGIPVLTKNADNRYSQTFNYTIKPAEAYAKRTEYLAVGTTKEFTFDNWNLASIASLYDDAYTADSQVIIKDKNGSDKEIKLNYLWQESVTKQSNSITIKVSLNNNSKNAGNAEDQYTDAEAYEALVKAGKLTVYIYSRANTQVPQLELDIIPVYFTFDGFRLQNNPTRPLVALSTPTTVSVVAANVECADNLERDSKITKAINDFNSELLAAQKNLMSTESLINFNRVANDSGIMNFAFDLKERKLTRSDLANPVTAISYLLVSANIVYENGCPVLSTNGQKVATYIPVQTFGADSGDNGNSTPNLEPAPNGRTRTLAQAIGTEVSYDISLPGVTYDSLLDRYEISAENTTPWKKGQSKWRAVFDLQENKVIISLDNDTSLFNKTLVVMAYNQDGELMYVLKIIPAYFTLEDILLSDHIDEDPVLIKAKDNNKTPEDPNWLANLNLGFHSVHYDKERTLACYDKDARIDSEKYTMITEKGGVAIAVRFNTQIKNVLTALNTSDLVIRDDKTKPGYVRIVAGIDYQDGIPTIVNTINCKALLQCVYRYEITKNLENTKALAIGSQAEYNVNRNFDATSIKYGYIDTATGEERWTTNMDNLGELGTLARNGAWTIRQSSVNPRCIRVDLEPNESLIGKRIRIAIFKSKPDEPDYVLNIIPAYFAVKDLTVKGQTPEDRDVYMYYGTDPDSPAELIFDAIVGKGGIDYSLNNLFQNPEKIRAFREKLQTTDASLLERLYDANAMSGDLRITAYLDYSTGIPQLVETDNGNGFVVRLDVDFWYAIYGRGNGNDLPPMPRGPRTRTEVQAVGTKAEYVIDLNRKLGMDMDVLVYDDAKLLERGWKASFANNVFTLELLSTEAAVETLLDSKKDLTFEFYSNSTLVYVLTIQPVLFKVTGIETIYPEQPVDLPTNPKYRAVAEYNFNVRYHNLPVAHYIEIFKGQLEDYPDLLEVTKIEQDGKKYLKLTAAIDYGTAGSKTAEDGVNDERSSRCYPQLLDVENNPLYTVESYIEYTESGVPSTSAKHYQAIGTTEYYYLGAEDKYIGAVVESDNDGVTAEVVTYNDNTKALKVTVAANKDLVNALATVQVKKNDTTVLTVEIKPVWFVVDGFEVVNHPERHMWIIVSEKNGEEKISDLLFRAHTHYAMDVENVALRSEIQAQIDLFNASLATYDSEQKQWVAGTAAQYLETSTIGAQYLIVRAAVVYNNANGVASIAPINKVTDTDTVAEPTSIVRDIFKYVRYSDKVAGIGMAQPNVPRSRTVDVTIGTTAEYTLDIPDFSGLNGNYKVYTNTNPDAATSDDSLVAYNNLGDWSVTGSGNNLTIDLSNADLTLAQSELKVFIYYDQSHVNDRPDSYDKENVAFVLTIHPVKYKITGFTITGYNGDEIYTDNITAFTSGLSSYDSERKFTPVYEYAERFYTTLKAEMDDFTKNQFMKSEYVAKTRTRGADESNHAVYYFQVTTAVTYNAFEGTPSLTDDTEYRLWNVFKVVVDGNDTSVDQAYQAIGTTKTYRVENVNLSEDVTINGANYTAVWSQANPDFVTVSLGQGAAIDTPFAITVGGATFSVTPVFYEVVGFEPVSHPERPAWVIEPQTVNEIKYRVITKASASTLQNVQAQINQLNEDLNNGAAEISLSEGQYIIINAAINYVDGYPVFTTMEDDRRNVVESVIKYRVWSAAQVPNPEHPPVMGKNSVNQVIGKTKAYTLKNIKGQISYPYIWVEGAGSMLSGFDDSIDGCTVTYEGLSVMVDPGRNILKIQLRPTADFRNNVMRVKVPYLTSVNGKDTWYSYCIEITPLLFELTGWTIESGVDEPAYKGDNIHPLPGVYVSQKSDDYILLTKDSKVSSVIKYVPRINKCKTAEGSLLDQLINEGINDLVATAATYMKHDYTPVKPVDTAGVSFDGLSLKRNFNDANRETDTKVTLSTYVVYKSGLPCLVQKSDQRVSNQIWVSTGYDIGVWERDTAGNKDLDAGETYAVQALGTTVDYSIEITKAASIDLNGIQVIDQETGKTVYIQNERANLVTLENLKIEEIEYKEEAVVDASDDENLQTASETVKIKVVNFSVTLAPVLALREHTIEVRIPYTDRAGAKHFYRCIIEPAVFVVDGFYLTAAADNNLALSGNDVVLELRAKTTYSDEVSVRNMANLMIQNFDTALNDAIRSQMLTFDPITSVSGGVNVRLLPYNNQILIQKISDLTAVNYITSTVRINYKNGIPQVVIDDSAFSLSDSLVDVQIRVSTQQGESSYFPGWNNVAAGDTSKNLQAIGISRDYPLVVSDMNVVFYYEYIEVFNGGLKNGNNTYEFFDYKVENNGRRELKISVTLRASARNLNNYIDIRIPYTTVNEEGKVVWYYYSLQVKPVLFEIRGWKLRIGDEIVDTITLDESAVELCFTPDVISGPLNVMYYSSADLAYVKSAIKRLETEINTYDAKISDGYYYLVLSNTPGANSDVNYSVYRDQSANVSYLVRVIGEASTTVMQVSASVAYSVSDFNKEYVEGAQAITAYANTTTAQRITSNISINTTDKNSSDTTDGNVTVFITQDNAERLKSLNSGVNYILMGDIDLSEIPSLKEKDGWKPVAFPENSTLDGNNFKIFFHTAGFDLSDGSIENIGLFTNIPETSVVKNVQLVFRRSATTDQVTRVKVDLAKYTSGTVNVGTLAGVNNGIVSNCAVLSEWQFNMPGLTKILNPVTGTNFEGSLPFNKDGYLFDDEYFYELGLKNNQTAVTHVYNRMGYEVKPNELGQWNQIEYDIYMNVVNWVVPDRTNVAKYENYSPMIFDENSLIDSYSPAEFFVTANSKELDVIVGGLVGYNTHVITNSRVLVDVKMDGPLYREDDATGNEPNVNSSIVGGLVGMNAENGVITASFFRDANVVNNAKANTTPDNQGAISKLGGFVGQNNGVIRQSYAMGSSTRKLTKESNSVSAAGAVRTTRNWIGGFVYENNGQITDCLVSVVIEATGSAQRAGGFVYKNSGTGKITNCVENNQVASKTQNDTYYVRFVYQNSDKESDARRVIRNNIKNAIYAGSKSGAISSDWTVDNTIDDIVMKQFIIGSNDFYNIRNYQGFSIGTDEDETWEVSAKNTIWVMTQYGPMLRAANDIAVSYRKTTLNWSPYLYNPGTEKNPYLVWNEDQFNRYTYIATAQATENDKGNYDSIEKHRQGNHIRLIDDVKMNGLKDSYKVIYTGTLEGNGFTMSGITLNTPTSRIQTIGLFGKTEYATIRNINIAISSLNSTVIYAGGIAGIAINTSFVDVNVTSSGAIRGSNFVGGFVGLNIINQTNVENYNLTSKVAVDAYYAADEQTRSGTNLFSTGTEYCRQTLYAQVKVNETLSNGQTYIAETTQAMVAAGGVFGMVTSNPNNYRVVDEEGNSTIYARELSEYFTRVNKVERKGNEHDDWYMKDASGKRIDDQVKNGRGLYYTDIIDMYNVTGDISRVTGEVAGGLIGIMDETIALHKPLLKNITTMKGKFYLGGIVGINLGKIAGEVYTYYEDNQKKESTYSAIPSTGWSVSSITGDESSYVYSALPVDADQDSEAQRYWGMVVGAVAGYNDGFNGNDNSGVIENLRVNVNVLGPEEKTKKQYVIGGIVGVNGDYGYVENAVNEYSSFGNNDIKVSPENTKKFGYYFGKIVGRSSSVNVNAFAPDTTARMRLVAVKEFMDNANYGADSNANAIKYVNALTFKTKDDGTENAFNIVQGETRKVQTMTMDEYYAYLSTNKPDTLVERVESLQPWINSLPEGETAKGIINGEEVWYQTYDSTAKNKLLKWVVDNAFLEWNDSDHNKLNGYAYQNFAAYLNYRAVSTRPGENETGFRNHLEEYREDRHAMAKVVFDYQYQVTDADEAKGNNITGPQNALIKWEYYEKFLFVKQHSKMKRELFEYQYADSHEAAIKSFGEEMYALMYENENGEFVNFINGKAQSAAGEFSALLNKKDFVKYSNEDAVQVFFNYMVYTDTQDQDKGVAVKKYQMELWRNQWKLSLAQYSYYMNHVYGTNYAIGPDAAKYPYTVPANLTGIKVAGVKSSYIGYVYAYKDNVAGQLTIQEYIKMMESESAIVLQYEEEWLKTGHMSSSKARTSTIGAIDLEWVTAAQYNSDVKNAIVKNEKDEFIYNNNEDQKWVALDEYSALKAKKLTITKYRDIVNLGGSLYGLKKFTENDNNKTADDYLFELRSTQYQWSTEQKNFIKSNYGSNGKDDLLTNQNATTTSYDWQYALAATTEGNILSCVDTSKGTLRAVYCNNDTQFENAGGNLVVDNNGNGEEDHGESVGRLSLGGSHGANFTNGDGKVYQFFNAGNMGQRIISLKAGEGLGAAIYVDVDGDQVFGDANSPAEPVGKDILAIYNLEAQKIVAGVYYGYKFYMTIDKNGVVNTAAAMTDEELNNFFTANKDGNVQKGEAYGYYAYPDFYTFDEKGNIDGFYKIARQIVANNLHYSSSNSENSGNQSDYLEEALWWKNQGFTAEQFDRIKAHAMTRGIPNNAYVIPGNDNSYSTREVGYTLADDWAGPSRTGTGNSGFKYDEFTPAEYTEIACGAKYFTDGIWYSTYADYILFSKMYYPGLVESINGDEITTTLPNHSKFRNPFIDPEDEDDNGIADSKKFLKKIATGNDLADAMDFATMRAAFMAMFRANGSTAEYIDWAKKNQYSVRNKVIDSTNGQSGYETNYKVFRLNHYIYWMQEKLDRKYKIEGTKFDAADFRWTLTQSVRSDIFYEGVTQQSRTTDLVEYRLNWWRTRDLYDVREQQNLNHNSDNPDFTYREIITFRDYCEWINIYAYSSTYKTDRGEFDDAEEGSEEAQSTDGWLTIEAFAVWKRMEKYENNVEYLNKIGGTAGQDVITAPILKRKISTTVFPRIYSSGEKIEDSANEQLYLPNTNVESVKQYYGWNGTNYNEIGMDETHARSAIDRYEYNERFNVRKVDRIYDSTKTAKTKESYLINDKKFAKECDYECGGLDKNGICTDHTHAAYIYNQWTKRYGVGGNFLYLDEKSINSNRQPDTDEYVQLYVPYDYFKKACQQIKSAFSEDNNFQGYFNYMKYWARNGSWTWICDISEFDGSLVGGSLTGTGHDPKLMVKHTYLDQKFWDEYDGTKSPVDTHDVIGHGLIFTDQDADRYKNYDWNDGKAYGWREY